MEHKLTEIDNPSIEQAAAGILIGKAEAIDKIINCRGFMIVTADEGQCESQFVCMGGDFITIYQTLKEEIVPRMEKRLKDKNII